MRNKEKPMKNLPPAPSHLSAEAKSWWGRVLKLYDLDDPALWILESACECWDAMRAAQGTVEREGSTFVDKHGQPRMHPACLLVRDYKAAWLRHVKQLGLDLEPLHDKPGRPAGR
jgi:P27 family predicted phage terminase small subunit